MISAVGIFFRALPSTFLMPGRKSAISVTTTVEKSHLSATSLILKKSTSMAMIILHLESLIWCSISSGISRGLKPVETPPAFCTATTLM